MTENELMIWGGLFVAIAIFGWLVWPKDTKPAELDPVKPEPAPVPVPAPTKEEPAVTAKPKKTPAKKTDAPKKTTTTKVKAAPKKSVKKGIK